MELVRKVYEPTISNLPGRERRQGREGREGVGGCSTAGKLRKHFGREGWMLYAATPRMAFLVSL
jgi:hypothetical protein